MSGHLSMDSVIRNNRNLLRDKKYFFKKKKNKFNITKGEIETKKISEIELSKLHNDFLKNQKKEHYKTYFINVLIIIPVFIFVYYTFNAIYEYHVSQLQEIYLKEKSEKQLTENNLIVTNSTHYMDYINEGDLWIKKQNWKNAIYNYKKAVAIFPEKFESNYRLALAYSYQCSSENINCDNGKKLNNRLLNYFPDNSKLKKLKQIFD